MGQLTIRLDEETISYFQEAERQDVSQTHADRTGF